MKVRKYLGYTVLITGALFVANLYAQSRGTPNTLRVRIDANGALVAASAAQTNPVTSCQFSNCRLATDASGNLLTVISGGSGVGTVTNIATTSPITGGPITTTGTIACATCGVTGTGLGQFAATSSATLATVINDETGTAGLLVFNTSPTFVTSIIDPLIVGGSGTTQTLSLRPTSGTGTTGADIQFQVGTNGGTPAGRIANSGFWQIGPTSASGSYGTQPASSLHLVSTTQLTQDHISADIVGASFTGRKARGTIDSPTQTLSGDNLANLIGQGWETTTPGWTSGAIGNILIQATENFTSAAQGTRVGINVTPTGSVTPARLMTLSATGAVWSLAGTAPTVANVGANSCGTTAASLAGNQTVGEVTVGATSGTQCRVLIPQATTTRFNGSCTNQTTANLCRLVAVDTTHFDLIGTFAAADVIAYTVFGR